jgi:hypothetical protein
MEGNMKTYLKLGLLTLTAVQFASAHSENIMLQYTMKAISNDVIQVSAATKKADPADVTDGMLLTGIVRSRTAVSMLQQIIDKKDGEMLPAIDEIAKPGTPEFKKLMDQYVDYLKQAIAKLQESEKLLKVEYDKIKNPETRDFKALKDKLKELETVISEAHKVFRP